MALKQAADDKKDQISISIRTAKLRIGYLDMVKTSRMLVMADRIGSGKLHLTAVSKCLPLFVATGHFNFVKSSYLIFRT